MKNKRLLFIPLTTTLIVSSFSFSFFISPTKASSAAQSIDASNLGEEEIRTYYEGIDNLSGDILLTSLSDIIDDHTSISYDSTFDWMAITDRDWIQSPLSEEELANYDFSNLTNDNPIMHLMYRNDNYLPSALRYYANVSENEKSFDREHVWAQTRGGFDTSNGMGTDMHHLFASDKMNNQNGHGNSDFGNVDKVSSQIGNTDYNNTGKTGTQNGSSVTVYEPHDDVKGDIARALFYMAVRYDETLSLTSEIQNSSVKGTIGNLDVLLEWNKTDPVDVFEIHRNNLIYNNIQHNRNPFIDFPSWADAIWGNETANVSEDTPSLIDNVIDLRPSRNGRLVIEHLPNKITYTRGEALDVTGLVVSYEHDGTRETITDYVLSIEDESILSNPGNYRVFVSSKLEGVIYTYFDINVTNTQEETPTQTVIYSTGFEESEGFSTGTNYQGNVTSGPDGQQWNIDGNFSSSSGNIDGVSARLRYYKNSTKLNELKMEFDVSNVSSIKFDTKMNANLTLDAFYSLDSGVTYNYLKQADGSDFKNVKTTSVRTYELDVANGSTSETVRFKFALGDASQKPSGGNYELVIDNISIYGENYASPFDDFLVVKDLPRTLTYEVGDTFTSENLLVNRLSYSAPASNFYDYTLSIEDGVILNTPGQIRVDVNPLDSSIKSTHFYITVIGGLSPAQAFANKLANYKTCVDYIEAYETLIDEYNALSDTDKEALKDIIIYDYDYQEYLNNGKSYEGLNPTSQIDAHTKWMQIIAMYDRANSATWVSSLFTNPQTYLTLLYIALAIGAITITVYFISKKRKQIR